MRSLAACEAMAIPGRTRANRLANVLTRQALAIDEKRGCEPRRDHREKM